MGHYDSCYAHDDFTEMTLAQKERYYPAFEKEMASKGEVYGTLDDVGGHILAEWGKSKGYIVSGWKTVCVKRNEKKE